MILPKHTNLDFPTFCTLPDPAYLTGLAGLAAALAALAALAGLAGLAGLARLAAGGLVNPI